MWISLHILGVQSFAQSRLWAKDWFPWDRSTRLLQEEEATGARLLGCSEIDGRLSFPTCTYWRTMSPGEAQLSPLKCFSHSIGLSKQRSHSQKGFGAALQGGDDRIFLPTSCTFECDGCGPGRCTRTEPWPSRAKSINGGGSLNPAYPLSLGIRTCLERTGAGRAESWWTGDSSTGRGCASASASERRRVSMNLPSTDISERINIRNVGVISREAGI